MGLCSKNKSQQDKELSEQSLCNADGDDDDGAANSDSSTENFDIWNQEGADSSSKKEQPTQKQLENTIDANNDQIIKPK